MTTKTTPRRKLDPKWSALPMLTAGYQMVRMADISCTNGLVITKVTFVGATREINAIGRTPQEAISAAFDQTWR